MTVRYHHRYGTLVNDYVCQYERIEKHEAVCQAIPGRDIDRSVGDILLDMMRPETIELTFAVQREIRERQNEVETLRRKKVERATYESDLARERFMRVDPGNRLVADALEADWNNKLRAQREAQEEVEQQRKRDVAVLDDETRQSVLRLTDNLPVLWRDPRVSDKDRKRMVRLLIEDVTLTRGSDLRVQIRFKAGATKTLTLPLPKPAWQQRETNPEVIARIDHLLDDHTDSGVADKLNREERVSGMKQKFTRVMVSRLRREYKLVSTEERLRRRGLITLEEISRRLGVSSTTIRFWRKAGLVVAHPYNDRNDYLFEMPTEGNIPKKSQGLKLSERVQAAKVLLHQPNEVHHAT